MRRESTMNSGMPRRGIILEQRSVAEIVSVLKFKKVCYTTFIKAKLYEENLV